jgi:HD superfamily phosphohydrolase
MKNVVNEYNTDTNSMNEFDLVYWINDLRKNNRLEKIISSHAFQRLYDISFLGAIDYSDCTKLPKIERTRAYHSLCVAGLANFIATKRNYNKELKENIVAAALVHDIGHMPLSHSAEPYIKSHLGYGHHEIGESIIDGQIYKDNTLYKVLRESFDPTFIKDLLNNKIKSEGSDIFSNKINIDTIDGIIRCLEYKGINKNNSLNRLSIAESAFLDPEKDKYRVLDNFWKAKHFVYCNYINTKKGAISDTLSQIYFKEVKTPNEEDLITDEKSWIKKHKILFHWLSKYKKSVIPPIIDQYEINITIRKYDIDVYENDILKRYIDEKKRSSFCVHNNSGLNSVQLDFDL